MMMLRALWAYRGFVYASVIREFKLKVSGSALGAWWVVLAPLSQVLMYALVLSSVMKARLPGVQSEYAYVIYLLAGISVWTFFSEVVTRATNIFIENANLLKKLSFPRISLPIIVALSAGINHFIFLFVTIPLVAILSGDISWVLIGLIPLSIITVAFALSLGILLGVLNVFYRDIGFLLGIVMQFWFWATPIIYTKDILPAKLQPFMNFNPMMPLVDGYHQIIYLNQMPNWQSLSGLLVGIFLLAIFSYLIFRRAQGEMVDAL